MKAEFSAQYAHTWRVFERIVADFSPEGWIHTGRGAILPARLAFHIVKACKYYLEDNSPMCFESGKPVDADWEKIPEADLPSQKDILACIRRFQEKTETWLREADLDAENKTFPWAGKTKAGVVLFLMRHTLYHLGELSSLLNESKNGTVEDHYVKAL